MLGRTIGLLITLSLIALACAALAQGPRHVPRIGYLSPVSAADALPYLEAFRQGLRALSWVEGQNFTLEAHWAEGQRALLPALAAELVRLPVDLIVTWSTPGVQAAKQATDSIPIVFALSGNPVGNRLVASLARPGGNITGLSHLASDELSVKRLELLTQAVPGITRVAALWDAPITQETMAKTLQVGAQALGLTLQTLQVRNPQEIAQAFAAMKQEGAEALFVWETVSTQAHQHLIVDLAAKYHLPAMYGSQEFVDIGGLMSYAANFPDLFRRAAIYVDKILKGAKPADLPVEQPIKFELVINLKAAQALGLTLSPTLLLQVDEVRQ